VVEALTAAGSRGDDMLKPLIGTPLAGFLRRIGSCPGHRSSFVRPGFSTIPLRPLIERISRRRHDLLVLIPPRGEGADNACSGRDECQIHYAGAVPENRRGDSVVLSPCGDPTGRGASPARRGGTRARLFREFQLPKAHCLVVGKDAEIARA
jgi:hypothetical protein